VTTSVFILEYRSRSESRFFRQRTGSERAGIDLSALANVYACGCSSPSSELRSAADVGDHPFTVVGTADARDADDRYEPCQIMSLPLRTRARHRTLRHR
jgi:hypothetical protein